MKKESISTNTRHYNICSMISANGSVKVGELCSKFKVSEVTIRKDLQQLENKGLLLRTHGGAVAVNQLHINNQISANKISETKQLIAEKAASLITDNCRILIDSGTTTKHIIPLLNNFNNLVVMTNSFSVAEQLLALANKPTLLMTGGTWDTRSSSFQGQAAEQMLNNYNFDLLFISADGIDLDKGTTTYNEITSLSKAMAQVSSKVVLLFESHKFTRKIPNLELSWDAIDIIITDNQIDKKIKDFIESKNIKVLISNE